MHHDQSDRQQDHGERRQSEKEARRLLARQALIVAGEHQDHRYFGDLGRLDLHGPDNQPALRTHAGLAGDVDRDQQQQRDHIDRPSEPQPDLGRHQRRRQQDCDGRAIADGMPRRPRIEAAAGRRIERHRTNGGDRRQHQDQAPVDAPQLLAEARCRRRAHRHRGHGHREAIFL